MWRGNIQENILYEDSQILVCHKPAGLAVQNAKMGSMDMESALKNYLAAKSGGKNAPWLGVLHRLDQPVEGVIVFAKTSAAAANINRQMTTDGIGKIYLAVTDRKVMDKEKKLIDYLYRDGRKNMSFATEKKTPGAKKAVLSYKLLEEISDNRTVSGYRSLVRIQLETGRHHQIRVQMSHTGLPLIGDRKYNPQRQLGAASGFVLLLSEFSASGNRKKMDFYVTPQGQAFPVFVFPSRCRNRRFLEKCKTLPKIMKKL